MKNLIKWMWLVAMLFTFTQITAKVWTPENLPMVHLQDERRYVCNPDGVLPQTVVDSTDALLYALERDKGVETVVVVVERIEGGDAYEFAMQLGRKYGVGDKKKSTGLIVVLATKDRKYQFLTGRGLEGTLPDAICRRVQNNVMVPALKKGEWGTAIYQSVKALDAYARGDESLTKGEAAEDEDLWIVGLALALTICVVIFIVYSAAHRTYKKCPQCDKRKWNAVRKKRYKKKQKYYICTTWRCQHCGHEEDEEEEDAGTSGGARSRGGAVVPPIIFGGYGGRGGGGFGGGSFGGGSFGGGGSGGSF